MKAAILFLIILCSSPVPGQDIQLRKRRAFEVPREIIMPVVAFQPDCALKFENVKSIYYLDYPSSADVFELRNVGRKPIRDFKVAAYTSYGGMWWQGRPSKDLANWIMPGALAPLSDGEDVEIVPLTDEMRDRFKLQNRKMGGVTVFMVVRIEFADGTVFDDEKSAKALEAYFEKLGRYQ